MAHFVTGSAGFIGSHLVDRLLQDGHEVVGYDNFSTGQPEFLTEAARSSRFTLVRGDTLDQESLTRAMRGADVVFHLAANARERTWSRTRSRRSTCWRRCAPMGSGASPSPPRVRFTGSRRSSRRRRRLPCPSRPPSTAPPSSRRKA